MARIGRIELPEFPLLLAPMEDITDAPFRRICKRYGADLTYTEFVASEALKRGIEKSLRKLAFSGTERPLGIQIFGNDAVSMSEAARIAAALEPDLIDLNFGCPVSKVVSKGCGAALLRTPQLMLGITSAVCKAVGVPVTVKTRLGWDEKSLNIVELAERLQDCGIAAITIHGRTKTQMYKGKADWTLIGQVKENPRMHIPVFGNGDISSPFIAGDFLSRYHVDGLMIGRAAIGNPWIFRDVRHFLRTGNILLSPGLKERLAVCREHLIASAEWKGERRGVIEMRKHYSGYFHGIGGFKPIRIQLLATTRLDEAVRILDNIPTG